MVYLYEIIFVARTTLIGQPVPGLLRPFRHKQGLPIIIEFKQKSLHRVCIYLNIVNHFSMSPFLFETLMQTFI